MPLSDTSLTDIGQGRGKTTNFWVRYEDSLPDQTNVINNANSLLSLIENEFTVTTGWCEYMCLNRWGVPGQDICCSY
jgi:hypothetical protein